MIAAEVLAGITVVIIMIMLFVSSRFFWGKFFVPKLNRCFILRQPSVNDVDFLKACNIIGGSDEAKIALAIRKTLAEMYDLPCEKFSPELMSGKFILLRKYNGQEREMYFERIAQRFKYPKFQPCDMHEIAYPDEMLKDDIPVREFISSFLDMYARDKQVMSSNPTGEMEAGK